MNKGINYTLDGLAEALNNAGERVIRIEAVRDNYKMKMSDGTVIESYNEVAEITLVDGDRLYVYIQCDSDVAACYDILSCFLNKKDWYSPRGEIERGVYIG